MNNEMIAKGKKYIMGTYSQAPIVIEKGEGVILTDNTGKEYIDMVSGIAVNSLGYGHPAVVKAILLERAADRAGGKALPGERSEQGVFLQQRRRSQ